MSIKKIRKHNSQKFLDDLRRVRDVLVHPELTQSYCRTTKRDLIKVAEDCEIHYYITDNIFVVKRDVMVVR